MLGKTRLHTCLHAHLFDSRSPQWEALGIWEQAFPLLFLLPVPTVISLFQPTDATEAVTRLTQVSHRLHGDRRDQRLLRKRSVADARGPWVLWDHSFWPLRVFMCPQYHLRAKCLSPVTCLLKSGVPLHSIPHKSILNFNMKTTRSSCSPLGQGQWVWSKPVILHLQSDPEGAQAAGPQLFCVTISDKTGRLIYPKQVLAV